MSQASQVTHSNEQGRRIFAAKVAGWHDRVHRLHRLLRALTSEAVNEQKPRDGYVTVTLPAAIWWAAKEEAVTPSPELNES